MIAASDDDLALKLLPPELVSLELQFQLNFVQRLVVCLIARFEFRKGQLKQRLIVTSLIVFAQQLTNYCRGALFAEWNGALESVATFCQLYQSPDGEQSFMHGCRLQHGTTAATTTL